MTDPTPEMVAMARRIARPFMREEWDEIQLGWWDHMPAIEAALAAIIETSEMAAKLNDEYEAFIRLGSVGDAATALRAYDHIKPENG